MFGLHLSYSLSHLLSIYPQAHSISKFQFSPRNFKLHLLINRNSTKLEFLYLPTIDSTTIYVKLFLHEISFLLIHFFIKANRILSSRLKVFRLVFDFQFLNN